MAGIPPLTQLSSLLAPESWHLLSAGMAGLQQRYATKTEVEHLFSTGAIKLRAHNTVVITLQLLCYALRRMGLGQLVPAVMDLSKAKEHQPGDALPDLPPVESDTPPVKLPACTIDLDTFPKHYSLPEELQGEQTLHSQMKDLITWLATPIMMNRSGKRSSKRTIQNIVKNVFLYLGFLHHHFKLVDFSLDLFLDLNRYSAYISFQIAKKNGRHCLTQQISNARKLCEFLNTAASPAKAAKISQAHKWLLALSKQIVTVLHINRTDLAVLQQEGKLMPAEDLVLALDKFRRHALQAVPSARSVTLSPYAARLLHDAALGCTLFGYIPPPRLSCVRTLQVPWSVGCLHEDCVDLPTHHSCIGNRLEVRNSELWIVLSHHKNKFKWDGTVIRFRLPTELESLMHAYLLRAHWVLCPGCPYVFTDMKARPMLKASKLSHYWEHILRRCEVEAVFSPAM